MVVVVNVALLVLVAFYGYEFYLGYKEATGTTWERILAGAKGSATILWARFVQLVTAAGLGIVSLTDFLNEPSVGQAIQSYLKPEYVAAVMVLIAAITEIARRRPGSQNPVS